VAAPRDVVNDVVQRASQMGVHVKTLLPWNPDSDLPSRQFNLLPDDALQSAGLSTDLKLGIGLGVLFVLMFLMALVLPVWQKREAAISLLPKLNAAKAESEKVQKTRTELEQLVGDANYIQGKKHAQVPVTLLVEDLARILPDTTWVAALEVKSGKQRELVLTGETASATKVLELLEQVPYLKNPNFRSPLTKVAGQTSEKFVIAAEIKPRALPPTAEEPLPGVAAGVAVPPSAPPAAALPPAPAVPPAMPTPPKDAAPAVSKVDAPKPAPAAPQAPAPSASTRPEAAKPVPPPVPPAVPPKAAVPASEPQKVKP
jgi:general secretion pathway protein L